MGVVGSVSCAVTHGPIQSGSAKIESRDIYNQAATQSLTRPWSVFQYDMYTICAIVHRRGYRISVARCHD